MSNDSEQKEVGSPDQTPKVTPSYTEIKDPKAESPEERKPPRRHLIPWGWLRIPLKIILWLIVIVLLIPVLLYIPPVQRFVKDTACKIVNKSTGMDIAIGEFRLGFPLNVRLNDVVVLDQHRDTMVSARSAIVDVKPLPLLKLDVQLKQLQLLDGYYRMVSPDSSMILSVRAGLLKTDDKARADIRTMDISLNKALLRDGNLSLYMDVWKKKPTPTDTTTTAMTISAADIVMENFTFGMSMLPTIDTLSLAANNIHLRKGVVNLAKNEVTWRKVSVDGGKAVYLTPTPEYVKSHPAPVTDTAEESDASAPMVIRGDTIMIDNFAALYGVKGAQPLPGFDPSYIEVSDVAVSMIDFYNEASTVLLPITRLQASERSGLTIVEGSGTIGVDSVGLKLHDVKINTPYSRIAATANVPFALMAMETSSPPMSLTADARIGVTDINCFMPDIKEYTSIIPAGKPIDLVANADGTLSHLVINNLDARISGVLALRAKGYADNVLDLKKLIASVKFDGDLADPSIAHRFIGESGVKVPAFKLTGEATARNENYGADFTLRTTAGDLAAKGHVGMNSERYKADVAVNHLNVAAIYPSLGIGEVTASLSADGAGFDPLNGKAQTNVDLNVLSLYYQKQHLTDISLKALLDHNTFNISGQSRNKGAQFLLDGKGSIEPDLYTADIRLDLQDINLEELGLSETMNNGSGIVRLTGTASPKRWLYDVNLALEQIDWNLPGQYIHLPNGLTANLNSTENTTALTVDADRTTLKFSALTGMERLIDDFTQLGEVVNKQIAERFISVDEITNCLPPFALSVRASGRGVLQQFLAPSGMSIDTVYGIIGKDSLLKGAVNLRRFMSSSINIDTVTLNLKQRNTLLDYKLHVGNRPGTLDEFAKIDLNGYIGTDRLALSLTQHNLKGEMGYRLGSTVALSDSVLSLHFTPLNSTIAYLPWKFNADNFVDFNIYNRKIEANLEAESRESSIMLRTEPIDTIGTDQLHVVLKNIKVEDFLRMSVFAPPITASINSDLKVIYTGTRLEGNGTLGINQLTYNKNKIGDFDLDLSAGMLGDRDSEIMAALKINGKRALGVYAALRNDSTGAFEPDSVGLRLMQFPLEIANPFLDNMVKLKGSLDGGMRMRGSFTSPVLNGYLKFDSVSVQVPMIGADLALDNDPIKIKDNIIDFGQFEIKGANANPLVLSGTVDATSFSNMGFDMSLDGNNFQLIGSKRNSTADLTGKLFLDLGAKVRGPMEHLDVSANLNILGTTDVLYTLSTPPDQIVQSNANESIVKFVNFNDTTQVVKADSVAQAMAIRVTAKVAISPGTRAAVDLSGSGKVELQPTANLTYFQNYMGDMRLNGNVTLGEGYVRYSIPVIGEKRFQFDPASYVNWTGNVMNPQLHIIATDEMKANVTTDGNSRLVNFIVGLNVTNNLSSPKVAFTLSTNDDITIENELASMTADQRQTQAMNLLLYGQYTGQNTKGNANLGGNMLYSFLESQLNSWAAKTIKGVDLSFGIDQYDKTTNGVSNTQTSYSYQVSKSLFNNRFKINVGGNYSTDSSADENLSDNLISDISVEYILKQTQDLSMSLSLFRHTGYESILEGEITETGVGFLMKRKLNNMFQLFLFHRKHKKKDSELPVVPDSLSTAITVKETDSIPQHDSSK